MTDNSQPNIIKPPQLPFIKCPLCDGPVDIMDFDRKIGKIPRHDRWNAPGQKCPNSGKSLKGIPIHNL